MKHYLADQNRTSKNVTVTSLVSWVIVSVCMQIFSVFPLKPTSVSTGPLFIQCTSYFFETSFRLIVKWRLTFLAPSTNCTQFTGLTVWNLWTEHWHHENAFLQTYAIAYTCVKQQEKLINIWSCMAVYERLQNINL